MRRTGFGTHRVVAARASELEREFSYGVVRQLVDPVLRGSTPERRRQLLDGVDAAVAALQLERSGAARGAGSEYATLHGLYWLVANLAEERPLLVVVDDAHWADRASLRFLAFLGPRLLELPVLLLVAAREQQWDPVGLFGATASDPAGRALLPAPLSREACAMLLRARLGRPVAEAFCAACHTASGGNPFLLHALVDELERDGTAPTAATAARVLVMGPRTVASAILARVAVLSPAAAPLAAALAVLGGDAPPEQTRRLAELQIGEARRASDELVRASVLAPGARSRFVHPIVRNAVYEDLARGVRDGLHRRAAQLLRVERAPPEQVAAHLMASEPAGDRQSCQTLRAAARQALAAGAADSAVAYLRRALAEPPPEEDRGALLTELGAAELRVDGPASVTHLADALALTAEPSARAQLATILSRALIFGGRTQAAAATAAGALAEIGDHEPGTRQQLQAIILAAATVDPSLAAARERVLARLGRVEGEQGFGPRALEAQLAFEDARRLAAPAAELAARADRALADGLLLEHDNGGVHFIGAVIVLTLADSDLALVWLDRGLERARRRGDIFALAAGRIFSCQARLVRGDLLAAVLDGAEGLELSDAWGIAIGPAWGSGYLATAQMEGGDLEAAQRTLAGAAPPGGDVPEDGSWLPYLDARARLLFVRGELRACLDTTLDCARRFAVLGGVNPAFMPWRSRAALCLAQLGEQPGRATTLVAEEVELARTWGEPRTLGAALHARALVQGDQAGEASLREAVEILKGSPAKLEYARALVALGAMLRRHGERRAARSPLRLGLELARRCGATPLAERAYHELRTTGASPRKLLRTGVETLTASERRVAQLAASGMSNKQIAQALFVTTKTVESHLAQSYRKLNISSRTELAGVLSQDRDSV